MNLLKKLNKKFRVNIDRISDKTIAIGMIIGLTISVIPILLLAFYNYPWADDFSAGDTAHWAWINTGSLWEVIKAAYENVVYNYQQWSGVYASVFWTSLQPGLFGEQFYGMTTCISIGLFVAAGIYMTYVIGSKYIMGNKYSLISLCALYLFTSIQCMPDGNEGLYWHAGVANYTWAFAFLVLLAACVLSIYKEERNGKKNGKLILACLLAILVGGGNYITALQGCIWLVLLDVVMVFADKRKENDSCGGALKKNLWVVIPTLVLIAAFAASVLAPGNKVRMGMSTGMSPVKAVFQSFVYALTIPIKEWFGWQTWVLLILAVPFMWNIVKEQKYKFAYPGIIAVLGYCLVAAGFTPSLYAQGRMEAGRLHDTVYFILILILYVVMFYVIGWIYQKKYGLSDRKRERTKELSVTSKCYIIGVVLLWVVGSVLHMGINVRIYVGTDALYTLISGQAEQYRQENEGRIALLESEEERVILPKFTEAPPLLRKDDISPNQEEWVNTAMAVYYGKESVQREE